MEYILAFGSAHRALKAEGALNGSRVANRVLPAPKALAEYCDLVISVAEGDLTGALRALKAARVKVKAVWRREGDGYVKV